MRLLILAVFLAFFLTVSYSSFLEADIMPHSGYSGTELLVNYSFDGFYGDGYLHFYAVKCKIGYKIGCSFSENDGKELLLEFNDIGFDDGEARLSFPESEQGLYRVCLKAYNHSKYSSDCDSHNYFLLKKEEPSRKLEWSLKNYTSVAGIGEDIKLFLNILNPLEEEVNLTVYSFVYREEEVILMSDSWTGNRKELVLAPHSSVDIEIREKGVELEGNFLLKIKLMYNNKTESIKLPLTVELEESKQIRVIALEHYFENNTFGIKFEIANLGKKEEKIECILKGGERTINSSFILKPKQQDYYYSEIKSEQATLLLYSGEWFFIEEFAPEGTSPPAEPPSGDVPTSPSISTATPQNSSAAGTLEDVICVPPTNCSCEQETDLKQISGHSAKAGQNIKKEEDTVNSPLITLALQSIALAGLILMLKMVK